MALTAIDDIDSLSAIPDAMVYPWSPRLKIPMVLNIRHSGDKRRLTWLRSTIPIIEIVNKEKLSDPPLTVFAL
jgi:hypothetical protein